MSLSRSRPEKDISTLRRRRIIILTLVCSGVIVPPALEELEELLCPPLLEETHERTLERFYLVTGDLGDLAITVHKATCDLFELEVTSDVGVDKDLSELSRGDDELGNKVNSVISVASKLRRRALVWSELAVQLVTSPLSAFAGTILVTTWITDLCQVQTGTVASVVVVTIHMKDLFALDGQKTRQDTLCQTGTKNDDLGDIACQSGYRTTSKRYQHTSYSSSMIREDLRKSGK